MKIFLLVLFTFTFNALASKDLPKTKTLWNWCAPCENPESVYYDKIRNKLFVSNVSGEGSAKDGKGWISVLTLDGKPQNKKWVSNLNAPKGMRSYGNYLWVTDIDEVVKIHIDSGKIEKKYKVDKAVFLNDLAIDSRGTVYVSDTLGTTIFQIKNHKVSVFLKGKHLDSPNGLLVHKEKLIVASWGLTTDFTTKTPGGIYEVDLKTKKISWTHRRVGNLDGLELDKKGRLVVTDWVTGTVYRIWRYGPKREVLMKRDKGAADIAYIAKDDLLIIPEMKKNNVVAFRVFTD